MKIAYLAHIRFPTEKAHGIQIMKMCEAFARAGHTVTLFVPTRKTDIVDDPFGYYNVDKNFIIQRLYTPDLIVFGKLGYMCMTVWFACMARIHTLSTYDVIYSRDVLLFSKFFFTKAKKVWEVHNKVSYPVSLLPIDGIIAISEGLKNVYPKAIVAHDGVDTVQFAVSGVEQKNIIMYIGSLYGWKGVGTLLDAAKDCLYPVHIVGGTEKEIHTLRTQYPHVVFRGYVPYSKLPYVQKEARVLVIPNSAKTEISRLYTSPLKVFAHMMSEVPIVASDIPSLREVLNDGNAFFAKPDSPHSFADTINNVIKNSQDAQKKAQQAYIDVKKYTWDNRAASIIRAIESL